MSAPAASPGQHVPRDERPDAYRAVWERKPVLRAIYSDYYRRIMAACVDGPVLEIGGGSGNLKQLRPQTFSTDVLPAPWLDAVCDAQALPFADASFANIVMVDVLHHIERPRRFLAEAQRVLRAGGRLVMLEPGITPLSWVFFKLLHEEPVIMRDDPLTEAPPNPNRDPWDSNQAIPTLLFGRDRARFAAAFPRLKLIEKRWLSLFAYPLSGGFKSWTLLPGALAPAVIKAEDVLLPVLGPLMAYRLFTVIERV